MSELRTIKHPPKFIKRHDKHQEASHVQK
jgi:hypothetical protein